MNQSSLDFWLEHLARGERMVALGGSDYHRRSELEQAPPRAPGTPTVWVYVPDAPNEAGILQAIRAGHVSLSDEPNGPFLDLGSGAAMMGDMLPRPADEYLNVNVRCLRGAGNWLRLYDQERMLVEQLISEEDELVALTTGSRESLFVRAELRSPDDGMRALTNPIYIHFTAK